MIKRYPTISRFILAAILFALALFLTDQIGKYVHFIYTGVILFTLVTWILLKTDNKNLNVLGLNFQPKNLSFFFLGLCAGILAFAFSTWCRTLYTGEKWNINFDVNWVMLAKGLIWVLPTVATQELLFRGYPFIKTVEKSNLLIANLIWGAVFVSYHDIWTNPYNIPFFAVSLFIAHYMFSSALLKSGTLYLPIGLHLGHNWSSQYFNGYSATDNAIFYLSDQKMFNSFSSSLVFWLTYNIGFILLAILLWKWKRVKEVNNIKSSQTTLAL